MGALEVIGKNIPASVPSQLQDINSRHTPELSFVIPAYNEGDNIVETLTRVSEKAKALVKSSEIILVDDGSHDLTLDNARSVAASIPIIILRLSRNFGKEQAIMAGLQRATGKAVVILDADLQEPLHYIDVMLERYREGHEMVYAVRAHRNDESRAKRLFTGIFYKLLNGGSETEIPADSRDFRILDRKVVDALCDLPERNRFMKGLYGWVGFRSVAVPVEIEARQGGISKFGLFGLFKLALTGLVILPCCKVAAMWADWKS